MVLSIIRWGFYPKGDAVEKTIKNNDLKGPFSHIKLRLLEYKYL